MVINFECKKADDTKNLAQILGESVRGGEVLAFKSDVGGGKTTFVKGLALGMGVTDVVQSPTFTLSQIHKAARGLELHHFDFYRLTSPGVMSAELTESLDQKNAVVAIEWGDIVHDILPPDCLQITLSTLENDARKITIAVPSTNNYIAKVLHDYQQKTGSPDATDT